MWPEEREGKGSYWCRQCGRAGDGIQFLIDFEANTYAEACAILGIEASVNPMAPRSARPMRTAPNSFSPKAHSSPEALWREKAQVLVDESQARLHDQPAVLQYLSGRGIDAAAIERFAIGWIDKNLFRTRESWGLDTVRKADGKAKKLFIPAGDPHPLPIRWRRFPPAGAPAQGGYRRGQGPEEILHRARIRCRAPYRR